MSWLRNDDDMLDHEKWRRALRIGGDAVMCTWWRLSSWCSRRLTDGEIPADMVEEVAQLKGSKTRSKSLRALIEARLVARRDDGGLTIVDYLQRNPSRAQVLAERDRRSKAQQGRRHVDRVTGHAGTSEPPCNDVPSRPVPSRPNPQIPPVVSEPTEVEGSPTVWRSLRGFVPSDELYAEARIQGVSRELFNERLRTLGNGPIGGNRGVFDRADYVRQQLPKWRAWAETEASRAFVAKRATADPNDRLQRQADRIRMLEEQESKGVQ